MENSRIEDIAQLLVATYAITVLRRMSGGIKVNENWRKRCNKELMQLSGDLYFHCQNMSVKLHWPL